MLELFREYTFVAAQRLPLRHHRAGRTHGHTFRLRVWVKGTPHPEAGWVMDRDELDRAVAPVLEELDHRFLNEIPGLEPCPSSEHVCRHIERRLKDTLPGLARIELWENPSMGCALELTA